MTVISFDVFIRLLDIFKFEKYNMLQQAINTLRFVSSLKSFEINVLNLSLMKKYDFPLREINLLIASIKVSVVKSVTNSRCVHRVLAQVNASVYALNSSANFE